MCGLVGHIGRRPRDLRVAVARLHHRGPDDQGFWSARTGDRFVELGFARLSILDLSQNGHQPMTSADGSIHLVFNGEIYNYRTLRLELEAFGRQFRSTSDSEVLLQAYEEFGVDVLSHLHGMFSFAIWDSHHEHLFAAVDRLGIKPLFWSEHGNEFTFASEIKALLAQDLSQDLDLEALYDYFRYLYVLPPRTSFRCIRRLGPGEMLLWRKDRITRTRYWRPPPPAATPRSEDEIIEELRPLLERIVREHMASDVPLGAFLSGGIDSSTLVALMSRHSRSPVRTFCMTFGAGEELFDEREHARVVARTFETAHTEIRVRPKLAEDLPALVRHFDEPFGNTTALLLYALCREVRKHVTVAIAGDGGDELFLGYPRYAGVRMSHWYSFVPRAVRTVLARAIAPLLRESTSGRHAFRRVREFIATGDLPPALMYDRWSGYYGPDDVQALLRPNVLRGAPASTAPLVQMFEEACGDDVDRASQVDLQTFLPHNILQCTDRMSMAHSLEVRVPFCDDRLVDFVARLPASSKMPGLRMKHLLRRAVSDLLPPSTLRRKKQGFVLPIGRWFNRDLKQLVDDMLGDDQLNRDGFLDPVFVGQIVKEHREGRRDYSLHLWALLVFQCWLKQYRISISAHAA